MPDRPKSPDRRAFLGEALRLGAGSLLIGSSLRAAPAENVSIPVAAGAGGAESAMAIQLPEIPDRVFIDHDGSGLVSAQRQGTRFTNAQGAVEMAGLASGTAVRVSCPGGLLSRVVLR